MKRIFILNGHPAETSLSRHLASAYAESAEQTGHTVRILHLHDLTFDIDFGFGGYQTVKPLEDDLEQVLHNLEWAEHVVLITPMWWGGLPAKLKGLFDRALLPGRAFDTRNSKWGMPAPLLAGRSARIVITSDTPGWFLRIAYKNALIWQIRGQILNLIGIKPSRFTHFSGASHPRPGQVEAWLQQVRRLGRTAS
ncbi:NAD(P)H-dependent oxidoreductase [Dickeya fangzhongdai]|uniref:NAD(P)H-dependent oxidoreductase n=1 Tax=Dickeya fangzhongdai TaxID=1778540 RepID=UPI002B2CB25D|nr:NAD(P)H-dependent oxidoreductase [Dickeya fangzhongdai]